MNQKHLRSIMTEITMSIIIIRYFQQLQKSIKIKVTKNNCNWTRTHNHLVHKRTLNHLAKLEHTTKDNLR